MLTSSQLETIKRILSERYIGESPFHELFSTLESLQKENGILREALEFIIRCDVCSEGVPRAREALAKVEALNDQT